MSTGAFLKEARNETDPGSRDVISHLRMTKLIHRSNSGYLFVRHLTDDNDDDDFI